MPSVPPQRVSVTQAEVGPPVLELLRTNDIVLLDVVRGLLESERVPLFVADAHMSGLEGSIGAFPRRLLVAADQLDRARRLVVAAGLGAELGER